MFLAIENFSNGDTSDEEGTTYAHVEFTVLFFLKLNWFEMLHAHTNNEPVNMREHTCISLPKSFHFFLKPE